MKFKKLKKLISKNQPITIILKNTNRLVCEVYEHKGRIPKKYNKFSVDSIAVDARKPRIECCLDLPNKDKKAIKKQNKKIKSTICTPETPFDLFSFSSMFGPMSPSQISDNIGKTKLSEVPGFEKTLPITNEDDEGNTYHISIDLKTGVLVNPSGYIESGLKIVKMLSRNEDPATYDSIEHICEEDFDRGDEFVTDDDIYYIWFKETGITTTIVRDNNGNTTSTVCRIGGTNIVF